VAAVPRWQLVYSAAMTAVIGWVLAYALADWAGWPRLTYFPYERDWQLVSGAAGPVPITYVGMVLWGVGGSLCGAAIAALACRLWRRPLPPRVLPLLGLWAVTAFLYGGTYFMWNLWPF
jgi:hypothetical protein